MTSPTSVEIFLHLLARADVGNELVGLEIHLANDIILRNFNTVQLRLVEEKLLDGNLLGNHAIGVSIEAASLIECIQACLLYFGFQDGFISHDPDHFVHHVVLCREGLTQAEQQHHT